MFKSNTERGGVPLTCSRGMRLLCSRKSLLLTCRAMSALIFTRGSFKIKMCFSLYQKRLFATMGVPKHDIFSMESKYGNGWGNFDKLPWGLSFIVPDVVYM